MGAGPRAVLALEGARTAARPAAEATHTAGLGTMTHLCLLLRSRAKGSLPAGTRGLATGPGCLEPF